MATIYSSCSPLDVNCYVYTDINLTVTASDGTYYDGTKCWNVASGQIYSSGSCTLRTLTIYAVNEGTATADMHYSLDGGTTWDFSNLTVPTTCGLLANISLGNGSGLLIRFGDPSNISVVFPANRADATTTCPLFDIGTATCNSQGFLMNQNRTSSFTINSDESCP
jgi:hypothetical protein